MNRRNIIAGTRTVWLIRTPRRIDISCSFVLYLRSFTLYNTWNADSFHFFWDFLKKFENRVVLCYPVLAGPLPPLSAGRRWATLASIIINLILSIAASVIAYYICKWLDEQFFKPSKHWSISTETPSVRQYRGRFCLASQRWTLLASYQSRIYIICDAWWNVNSFAQNFPPCQSLPY